MGFLNHETPTAKVADGRLILTLPDAETPALWVMDLADAATSVLRLETDRQGFFVLKKHGGKGAAETVAVYRDRARGTRALNRASKALEKARNTRPLSGPHGQPVIIRPASRIGRAFIYFVVAWFFLWMVGLDRVVLQTVLSPFLPTQSQMAAMAQQQAQQQQQQSQQAQPQSGAAKSAPAGVPLSADEFLKNQGVGANPLQMGE